MKWSGFRAAMAGPTEGADAIAGEERRKTLDLLLANPTSRARVVVDKFLALCAQLIVLGVVLWSLLVALTAIFDVDLGAWVLAAATAHALAFAIAFGAAALALGAAVGSKPAASGVVTSFAAASYVWESVTAIVPDLEGFAWLSPFHHYVASDPLVRGFGLSYLLAFVAAAVVLVALGVLAFSKRDVRN